eukprot:756902-Hanusia_phi.AAC.1
MSPIRSSGWWGYHDAEALGSGGSVCGCPAGEESSHPHGPPQYLAEGPQGMIRVVIGPGCRGHSGGGSWPDG